MKLGDNGDFVKNQLVKHKYNGELWYQFEVLVKNMETISVEWTAIFNNNNNNVPVFAQLHNLVEHRLFYF